MPPTERLKPTLAEHAVGVPGLRSGLHLTPYDPCPWSTDDRLAGRAGVVMVGVAERGGLVTDYPTPKRAIYATEQAAWDGIRRLGLTGTHATYRCGICRGWHIAPRAEALRHRTAGEKP